MNQIKTPVVAGLFYPGSPAALQHDIDGYLHAARADGRARPRALIAPHAGYRYSGPIAASAYAALAPWADEVRRAVVLAPSHRVPFHGIALSSADRFETPLGEIAVDTAATAQLAGLPGVAVFDAAFADEHALEVQLPFLQVVLGDFRLVPLIVGDADAKLVDPVIEMLLDDETLVVVSSDLSHYHDYATCRRRDAETTAHIEHLEGDRIGPYDACGAFPIRGLLQTARRHGWQARTLDLRNSGDTSGDRSRVVGYGAYGFF
jgi:AmmeMemoRadiSam system protein B